MSRQANNPFSSSLALRSAILDAVVTPFSQTARAGLCEAVTEAVGAQVRGSFTPKAEVPIDAVDSIIRREYSERGQGITLYIMNPEAVLTSPIGSSDESRAFRCTTVHFPADCPGVCACLSATLSNFVTILCSAGMTSWCARMRTLLPRRPLFR